MRVETLYPAPMPLRAGRKAAHLGLVALLLLGLFPPAVAAQTAGVVTTVEGTVPAARASLPSSVGLRFRDPILIGDRIVTGDRSLARLLLGGKAVVTVRERSSVTINDVPGRAT